MPSTNQHAEGCFFKSKLPLGKLVWMLLSWASDIISVGWAAYKKVAQINGGVRLQDAEIHTQHIENVWMRAKRHHQGLI